MPCESVELLSNLGKPLSKFLSYVAYEVSGHLELYFSVTSCKYSWNQCHLSIDVLVVMQK